MADQLHKILSRVIYKDSLNMWGKLFLSATGETGGGWLVDSWSSHGAPYWLPKMHWFDRRENKLYDFYPNLGIQTAKEVTDIEPERAKFIKETIATWEKEWLESESKTY